MKNKILKIIIAATLCGTLSAVIETLGFNFNVLTLGENESSSQISYETSTKKDKNIIKLPTDNKYINKLIIDYSADEHIPFELSYTITDSYSGEVAKSYQDSFDNILTTSVTNIKSKVASATITYDKKYDLVINSITIDNDFHFNFYRFTFTFLALLLLCSFYFFYKSGFTIAKLHIYFASTCLLLGSMIIIAQPSAVFYSLDDQIHFQRAQSIFTDHTYNTGEYQMTRGDPTESVGGKAIGSAEEQIAQDDYNNSNTEIPYFNARTTLKYDKIAYLPMSIGYELAKLVHLPFTIAFCIGKFFNLLFYVALLSYAIKRAKVGKRLLSIIALIPTNIFLASQYSYDPSVFAGIAVFSVELINLYVDKSTKFNFKTALITIASISLACFTKAVYAPLLLLVLLIPRKKFQNKKQSLCVKTGFICIALLLASTFVLPTLSGNMESDTRGGDTSVSEQLSLIISQPLGYAQVLGNNAVKNFTDKFIGTNALGNFGYITTPVLSPDSNLYLILLIFIIFFFFTDNANNLLTKKQRLWIIALDIATIILIWTALYLSYTPVGFPNINGVQNRYFLPLLFLTFIAVQPTNIKNKINPKIYNAMSIVIPAITVLITTYACILYPYAF